MTQTKKQKKSMMTIPELRKTFDHIEEFTMNLLGKEKDPKKRRVAFQSEWMKVFHRAVDDKAADAYLDFESKKVKKMGKTRKQKGGGSDGAPLDYSTRPGIYGVYGTFPEYISGGFSTFGNATNTMAIQQRCNSPEQAAAFPPPYTGFGAVSLAQKGGASRKASKRLRKTRKQKGGTWGDFVSALSFRPLTATAPPGPAYSAMMDFKGSPTYPSSLANTGTPPYQSNKPMASVATAGVITRSLGNEI